VARLILFIVDLIVSWKGWESNREERMEGYNGTNEIKKRKRGGKG
jgi:hypothetical protein